jgi:hypothetical protein
MIKEPSLIAKGELIKTEAIIPDAEKIKKFFDDVVDDELSLPEILFEWFNNSDSDGIILFPTLNFETQINLIRDDIPYFYTILVDDKPLEFIFLKEIDRLLPNDLKNVEELSGVGKIITNFELKFEDFPKKFTRANNTEFFNLSKKNIIINNIRLIIDDEPKLKLTGRAAELARKKGLK